MEFSLYTHRCNKQAQQMYICMNDRNQPTSPKPSKLLPHWQQVPKWMKNLEIQYSMGSSLIPHIVSGIKCTYPITNKRRNSHYVEDPQNAPKRYVMRIKHPKDPKNIFWTRDNGDIQYDNHAKHGSKIYPKTHECKDIRNTYKHSLNKY